jgi:hypothetical protein
MAIKKTIEIDVDVVRANGGLENFTQNFKKSEEAAKSLRTQLREAQLEVAALSDKFGATSREAVEAAKRAAELKDRIGDAKALTEAFNPDAKFKALSAALTGVAGGFSVVTGLMGTLGTESKSTQEAILKVQSAMAIASGAQAVGESIDSFKQLGAVVKSFTLVQRISAAAQLIWNAAMAANPIGAIVVVVTALIAAGYALVKMFISSSEAADAAAANNKKLAKQMDLLSESIAKANAEGDLNRETQYRMAEASGASTKALRELNIALADQAIAQKKANAEKAQAIYFSTLQSDADEEQTKKAKELFEKANKDYADAINARTKIRIDNQVQEVQEVTDAREKEKEKQNKHNEELLANQKKAAEEKLEIEKKLAAEFLAFKAAVNKAEFDIKFQAQKEADEVEKSLLNETPQEKLDREFQEKKAILEADNRSTLELQSQYITESELISQNAIDKKKETDKAAADAEIKLEEEKQAAKQKALQAFSSGLKTAANLLGESTAAGKAMAVAATTIDTIQSGVSAFKGMVAAVPGPVGIGLGAVAAAGALASGYASVKKILAVKTPGGGGGGGGVGGGGFAPPPPPPQFNIVGQSSTNQLSQTIATQQNRPIQTYVVGNQVSTQQSLDRNAVATSTFG